MKNGTRVKVVNNSGVAADTMVFNPETADCLSKLYPISAVHVEAKAGQPVRVLLELALAEMDVTGGVVFVMRAPDSGEYEAVKSVEFANGKRYSF